MPIVFRCKTCGYVLHYLEYVGQDYIGVPSLTEILGKYGYMCPKCKTRLSPPSREDIIITSVAVARRRNMMPIRVGDEYYVPTSILEQHLKKVVGVASEASE